MSIRELTDKLIVKRDDAGEDFIPLKNGWHAYEHGEKKVGIYTTSKRPIATFKALAKKIPGLYMTQHGDEELICVFAYTSAPEAIKLLRSIGAHKRVEVSPEVLEAKIERGKLLADHRWGKKGQS